MHNQLIYQIAICELEGVGPINAKNLISHCGGVEEVFNASKQILEAIPGIGSISASKILKSKTDALQRAQLEVEYLEKHPEIKPIFYTDEEYSNRLKFCVDSPLLVYYNGSEALNAPKMIAVVGTRKITPYGKTIIERFIEQLAQAKVVVVSGLAYGVDTYVHKICVQHEVSTIGVLAHGLDRIYPATNKKLAKQMINRGGLLTEYLHETNPDRENFPSRNRIIAGMCDATVIIESGAKGGSLITGDLALSYNRDVFAFPGRVGDKYSIGCNEFIKRQKALMIENASDLFYHLGWEQKRIRKKQQRSLFVELTEQERLIVNQLQRDALSPEAISIKSLLTLSQVSTHLLNLELKGVIRSLPGNLYSVN